MFNYEKEVVLLKRDARDELVWMPNINQTTKAEVDPDIYVFLSRPHSPR